MGKIKAVALVSSGLDSMLAAKVVHDLGIDVIGLHCVFHFDPTADLNVQENMDTLFTPVGIPIKVKDVTDDFFKVLLDPEHGYGSQFNPCIDCKIFMFMQAKQFMKEINASFLITGEVLGQRPMTQNKPMMYHIEKEADMKGLVLRPLTAKNLRESIPEQNGWIQRNQLHEISGRGRKDQMALATALGISKYNQPAGGCILTLPQFSERAQALFQHRPKQDLTVSDIQLLRLGRHFWPNDHLHVIVGRYETDNQYLENYAKGRTLIEPSEISGPLTLAQGIENEADLEVAASITARYCKHQNQSIKMRCVNHHGTKELSVFAFNKEEINTWRV